ncbi:MAG: hypothetical protein IJQ15_04255 [Synergistaceae bacterium]|nr:hypothetical protein [Synergistaceae bacterium]
MRKFLTALLLLTLTVPAESAEVPRADIDEAERYFNNAYIHFMRRDYRDAQVYLDQAIRQNTYMVDYYLLAALNLNRMGYTDEAMTSLNGYLEVRPLDVSAPRIKRNFDEQDGVLRSVLGTAPIPVSWRYSESNVQSEWNTGYTRPFSIRGLGKARSLGNTICIPDQFGDKIYIRQDGRNFLGGTGSMREVGVQSPVIAIPMGDGTFRIFNDDGDMYSFASSRLSEPNVSADYVATLPSVVVSDAEIIAENLFAVSDPAERNIAFYSTARGDLRVRYWRPELLDGDFLFEPVAIECYADWLAVADRMNDRVYLVNVISHEYFDIRNIRKPRDLIWSGTGELFVLTDEGDIYDYIVDFGTRTYANRNAGAWRDGIRNAWTFFKSSEGDISWFDMSVSRIYKAIMMPARDEVPGFLSIYNPSIASDTENRESFVLEAALMSPFMHYANNARIVAQSVWNDRNMRCNVIWQRPRTFDAVLFHMPVPRGTLFPLNARPSQVTSGRDVQSVLASVWLLHRETLTNVIVDASIPFTDEDMLMLLKFCILNGLELDVYARDIPSLGLLRASSFTGGKTLYALGNTLELPVQRTHMQIQIPLPEELSSSGYPGRSMLAVYLDAGLIQSRAWIPLYPDMFSK